MAKARRKTKSKEHIEEPAPQPVTESPVVAEPPATPVEREAAHTNGHQAANENSHAARHQQHREPGQSHADAVGKRSERQPGYTEGFKDRVIGAHRLEHHSPYLSIIRFEEKPSDPVRAKLQEAGFSWNQRNMEWKRDINFETRQQDREDARRVFDEVCQMIRQERGITHTFGGAS